MKIQNYHPSDIREPHLDAAVDIKKLIKAAGTGAKLSRHLTFEEACRIMNYMLSDRMTDAQIGAFFQSERMKGQSPEELFGFAKILREHSWVFEPVSDDVLDSASPYDGMVKTLNLKIAEAFVFAACGGKMLFHGAPCLPPKRGLGPVEIFQELGVPFSTSPEDVRDCLERFGLAFYSAELFTPPLLKLRKIREELNFRTYLNTVEKMLNLGAARTITVSISHLPFFEVNFKTARLLGYRTGAVIRGVEGSEMLSVSRPCRVLRFVEDESVEETLHAKDFGIHASSDPGFEPLPVAAQKNIDVLSAKNSVEQDFVAYNAGYKLHLVGKCRNILEGIAMARNVISSGKAGMLFEKFRERR